jgi:hypothetical protein
MISFPLQLRHMGVSIFVLIHSWLILHKHYYKSLVVFFNPLFVHSSLSIMCVHYCLGWIPPLHTTVYVATPLWPSVGVKPNTSKVEDLESSGTPECLEFDSKAQSTSHWGVLGVIEKVLKRRYRKWPRIGHLDICSPSYGQKKGRESNWQFDSRPLKVENRPLPDLRIESAIRRWKDLDEDYKFGSDLVAIRLCSRELWAPKVPGLQPGQFRDNFGTLTWESREKEPLRCSLGGEAQRIL